MGDLALDRVGPVHRVLVHDVRVARLELQLGQRLEELARLDLRLADPRVVDHLVVLLGHRDVGERHTVDALDVIRREQVHVVVVLGQLERDVRDDDAEGQRLDPDLLVGVLPLGVQEAVDVGVMGVQVHRARALPRAELVGVGERVLQQLHDRDDARALVLDVLDRRAVLANVAQQQRNPAAALGQLQRRVDGAPDGLHVVLDAKKKAIVHDRATNRVRMRALDVEVVHRLRNVFRALQVADSVDVAPVHDLVCRARRPLLPHVVVQVLADVEDEVFVGAGQPGHENLSRHVAGLVDVLANSGHDADSAQEELHLVDEFRVHQVEHHPAGGRAPIPAEEPGQQAALEFLVGCQDLVGQTLQVVSRANHRQEERSHDLAIAHHAHRLVRHTLVDGEIGGEDSLERCRQLLLVLEFVCADREVDAIGRLRAVWS